MAAIPLFLLSSQTRESVPLRAAAWCFCHFLRKASEFHSASSPQAKGRVERAHGTHQDRLVKKLRLAGTFRLLTFDFWPAYLQYSTDRN
jgi:hypothetical protein